MNVIKKLYGNVIWILLDLFYHDFHLELDVYSKSLFWLWGVWC